MPLWKIYHTPGAFGSAASKEAVAADITKFYTTHTGMPAFYVGVVFLPLPDHGLYIGGKPRDAAAPFVRFEVEQIHIRLPDQDAVYQRSIEGLCAMLAPHLEGASWEIHVDETDRRLWAIDGIRPPEWKSEEEGKWREAGKPLPRL